MEHRRIRYWCCHLDGGGDCYNRVMRRRLTLNQAAWIGSKNNFETQSTSNSALYFYRIFILFKISCSFLIAIHFKHVSLINKLKIMGKRLALPALHGDCQMVTTPWKIPRRHLQCPTTKSYPKLYIHEYRQFIFK
jgi:hypothetical protein